MQFPRLPPALSTCHGFPQVGDGRAALLKVHNSHLSKSINSLVDQNFYEEGESDLHIVVYRGSHL